MLFTIKLNTFYITQFSTNREKAQRHPKDDERSNDKVRWCHIRHWTNSWHNDWLWNFYVTWWCFGFVRKFLTDILWAVLANSMSRNTKIFQFRKICMALWFSNKNWIIKLVESMLVTDGEDSLCWWRLWDVFTLKKSPILRKSRKHSCSATTILKLSPSWNHQDNVVTNITVALRLKTVYCRWSAYCVSKDTVLTVKMWLCFKW